MRRAMRSVFRLFGIVMCYAASGMSVGAQTDLRLARASLLVRCEDGAAQGERLRNGHLEVEELLLDEAFDSFDVRNGIDEVAEEYARLGQETSQCLVEGLAWHILASSAVRNPPRAREDREFLTAGLEDTAGTRENLAHTIVQRNPSPSELEAAVSRAIDIYVAAHRQANGRTVVEAHEAEGLLRRGLESARTHVPRLRAVYEEWMSQWPTAQIQDSSGTSFRGRPGRGRPMPAPGDTYGKSTQPDKVPPPPGKAVPPPSRPAEPPANAVTIRLAGLLAGTLVQQVSYRNTTASCVAFDPMVLGSDGTNTLVTMLVSLGQPITSLSLQPGAETTVFYGLRAGTQTPVVRNLRWC
jgi:hypothetical protein